MSKVLGVIIALLVIIVLFSSFYIVPEGKQAVLLQFGKPVGKPIQEAGLRFKLPWPIQEARFFEKKILKWDGDPNQIPTKDKKYIYVDTTAWWRISDALKFLQTVATETGAHSRLDDIIDAVARNFVSKNILVEVVRSADWVAPVRDEELEGGRVTVTPILDVEMKAKIDLGREKITRAILEEASKITPQYGIELVDVRIKRINYVESVRNKVYERMISERKRVAAEYRSEGEGKKAEILGTMEKELKKIRSGAYRTAQEIRGKADAEATRIYGLAYSRDADFYTFYKTLETYRTASNNNAYIILSTDSDYYKYLKKIWK
jgi:membrane protease subunit HflC